jgi:serine/threonine protein kinase
MTKDDEPLLPNGERPPKGLAATIMQCFNEFAIAKVRGKRQLRKDAISRERRAISDSEFQGAIESLVASSLIEAVPHPPPMIRPPTDIGIPNARIPNLRLAHEPDEDDECFAATRLGRKAAQLLTNAASGPWLLGPERAEDQVLHVVINRGALSGVKFETIDVHCATLPTETVSSILEGLISKGVVAQKKPDSYAVTEDGIGSAYALSSELNQMLQAKAVAQAESWMSSELAKRGVAPISGEGSPKAEEDLNQFLPAELRPRFRAVLHLGVGGYASVYQIAELESGRRWALKVTREDPEARERSRREVEANTALLHPNILTAVEKHHSGSWFIFPLAEGTLGQLLDWGVKDRSIAPHVAIALCSALDYAHEKNFLHRDLHPENIFWHDGIWKVGDWGLTVARGNRRLTRTQSLGGTENWSAPEQINNLRAADERSDIFSVGRIVQWIITGQVPRPGTTPNISITEPLAAFVNAATRFDPSERPATAREAIALLPGAPTVIVGNSPRSLTVAQDPPPNPLDDGQKAGLKAIIRQWLFRAGSSGHAKGEPVVFSKLDDALGLPRGTAAKLLPEVALNEDGWAIQTQGAADIDLVYYPRAKDCQILLDYQMRGGSSNDHKYALLVSVKNSSKGRFDDWEVVLDFPTPFLESPEAMAIRVANSSNSARTIFRWGSHTLKASLRINDISTLEFRYHVDIENQQHAQLLDELAKVQVSVEGQVIREVCRPIRGLQKLT